MDYVSTRIAAALARFRPNLEADEYGVPDEVNLSPGVCVAHVELEPTEDGLLDPATDGGAFTRLYVAAADRDAATARFAEWAAGESVRIRETEWCCDCSQLTWKTPEDAGAAVDVRNEVLCVNAARSDPQVFHGDLHLWPADATE